jgi:hypothetical protein
MEDLTMAMTRWDPIEEALSLRQAMGRWLENSVDRPLRRFMPPAISLTARQST